MSNFSFIERFPDGSVRAPFNCSPIIHPASRSFNWTYDEGRGISMIRVEDIQTTAVVVLGYSRPRLVGPLARVQSMILKCQGLRNRTPNDAAISGTIFEVVEMPDETPVTP